MVSRSLGHIIIPTLGVIILSTVNRDKLVSAISDDPAIGFVYIAEVKNVDLFSRAYLKTFYKDSPKSNKDLLNIVLIIVDALRADHMSLYGYERKTTPFIDSLFKEKKLKKIDIAFSSSNHTLTSVGNILFSERISNLEQNRIGLHEVLKHHSYKLNFILSGVHKDWYDLSGYYGKNIDFYLDGQDSKSYGPNNDFLILEHLNKVHPFSEEGKSFFLFHLMSVHSVGTKNENYKVYAPNKLNLIERSNVTKGLAYTNNYDNGILQADYIISGIFLKLSELGYLSNSLVIIASDHGESLGSKGYFGHGNFLNQDELRIPMLIYDTDSTLYQNVAFSTHIDIAPTILKRIKITSPGLWKGSSMTDQTYGKFYFHYGMGDSYSLTYLDSNKIICYRKDWENKIPIEKFYSVDKSFREFDIDISDSLSRIIRRQYNEESQRVE
jgi:membrane-anchored protein YejM (alkaline phosphatase superfamily)